MIQLIILELIKAILVGVFLFYFYFIAKKAFRIGKALDDFLVSKSSNLNPKFKKTVQKKLLIKFLFKKYDASRIEVFLNELSQQELFINNLIQ